MKAFNSFQLTFMFAAFPFLLDYLQDATFRGAGPAFYCACAAYVVGFIGMCTAVYENL
jgi:hypothetical protein